MQVKIGRKIYNTEKANEVTRKLVSYFGDSHGYEEVLFHKKDDEFFIFGQGGEDSCYAEPKIKVLSKDEAQLWLNAILGEDEAASIIKKFTTKKRGNKKD